MTFKLPLDLRVRLWVAPLAAIVGAQAPSLAQSPSRESARGAPAHEHYVHSSLADRPAPGGQVAPRLQNLGSHVFPVTT